MVSPFSTRLLSLVLVLGLLWVGVQHARYLCHAGGERDRPSTASSVVPGGSCHDRASPVSAPGGGHSSLPPCCSTGVLVAALPSGKHLALVAAAAAARPLSTLLPVSLAPAAVLPAAPLRAFARGVAERSPFSGLRPHLAYRALLI